MRFLALLLVLLLHAGSFAQEAKTPPAEPQRPSEQFRVRVEVDLVTAPLVVQDGSGDYIYDLTGDDILVMDNGVRQEITNFEPALQPVSLVILLDRSSRIEPLLDRVRTSGILFTSYIMGQFGEAAVVAFDHEVEIKQKFTSDPDKIIKAIESLEPGGDLTRLADALDRGVRMLLERPEGRRPVIVAVTQAGDSGSTVPIGEPLRVAQLAGISVYTVELSKLLADSMRPLEDTPTREPPHPPGTFPRPPIPGQPQTPTTDAQQYGQADLLSAIIALVQTLQGTVKENILEAYSQGTGGLHYRPLRRKSFEEALDRIGQDLHNQYLVSYRPSNRKQQGFHRIQIAVNRSGVTARTRPGYYIGPPQP